MEGDLLGGDSFREVENVAERFEETFLFHIVEEIQITLATAAKWVNIKQANAALQYYAVKYTCVNGDKQYTSLERFRSKAKSTVSNQ